MNKESEKHLRHMLMTGEYPGDYIRNTAQDWVKELQSQVKMLKEFIEENQWGTENLCIGCGHWYDKHEKYCELIKLLEDKNNV